MKLDIVSSLYGLEPGGAEISTRIMCDVLLRMNVDVEVVSTRTPALSQPRGVVLPELERIPTGVILFTPNRILDNLFRAAYLRRWRERRPDAVLIEDHLGIVGAVEAVERLRTEGQNIVLAMTQMWEVDSEFFFKFRPLPVAAAFVHRFRVANALTRRMDLVNGATEYMRRRVIDRLGVAPEKCEIFHTVGINPSADVHPVTPQRPLLLAPGRINPEKGSLFFFEAVKELAKRRRDFDALFLGGGPYEKRLRAMITRAGLDDVCRVSGKLPYDQFVQRYSEASMVAIPIMYPSAYTRVVLESLYYGKPVVTFDHGSMPEIIRNGVTGFRTPPGDAAAFARACEAFIDDPSLTEKMAPECRRVAAEFADVTAAVPLLVKRLEALVAQRRLASGAVEPLVERV